MSEYYLIAQLPSLDGISDGTPIPITEEEFYELCRSTLNNKSMSELEDATLLPAINPKKSGSALLRAWNEGERNFRLALAKVRAEKMDKPFNLGGPIASELIKIASDAVEIENPLDAEKFLLSYRLKFLETLRPIDNFSNEYIIYYALKLKLLLRIRKFDNKLGREEYTKIYNSILRGDSLEVEK